MLKGRPPSRTALQPLGVCPSGRERDGKVDLRALNGGGVVIQADTQEKKGKARLRAILITWVA